MNSILRILSLVGVVTVALGASEPKPMTNADVVGMVKAELPESVVVLAVQKGPAEFDTSPTALIALKSGGVPPKVIEAMITRQSPVETKSENSSPTESEAQKLFSDLAHSQSGGVISVLSFQKTNGQLSTVNGVPIYLMMFDMMIRFSDKCIWRNVTGDSTLTFNVAQAPRGTGMEAILQASQNPGLWVEGGSVFSVKVEARFEKTEQGWKPWRVEHKSIDRKSESDVVAAKGRKDAKALAADHPFAKADLESFLAKPSVAPAGAGPMKSAGRLRFSCPEGYVTKASDGNSCTIGKSEGGSAGGMITVIGESLGFLKRNLTLKQAAAQISHDLKAQMPGCNITDGISAKLAGADAVLFALTFSEKGKTLRKAVMISVSQKMQIVVILHTEPEKFGNEWDGFRLVCDSLVIESK